MPNPFKDAIEKSGVDLTECEGRFGCFQSGCGGKVVGFALYDEAAQMLYFTCPDGHKNEVSISL